MDLIILSGLPASGKSTVARMLQTAFPYPILEKDRIKECLFDTLGFQSHEEKRRLDAAAARILLQTAEELLAAGGSVILDNNFDIAAGAALRELQARRRPRSVTSGISLGIWRTRGTPATPCRTGIRRCRGTRRWRPWNGRALPGGISTAAWARSPGTGPCSLWTPQTWRPWTGTPCSPRSAPPWKPSEGKIVLFAGKGSSKRKACR